MAKFFFNFRQGSAYSPDVDGIEFVSAEAAYLEAFKAAQDMWRELLIQRQDPFLCAFEVSDEEGRHLFTLPFAEVLEVCRGRTPEKEHRAPTVTVITQAIAYRRDAQRALAEVSLAMEDARVTMREAIQLLAAVGKVL